MTRMRPTSANDLARAIKAARRAAEAGARKALEALAVDRARAHDSMDECRELASERGVDPWQLAAAFAQRMLPRIFRADDPALAVRLPPETREALERELDALPAVVFTSDDALGWTYQFWQADRKDEVNRRGVKAPRSCRPSRGRSQSCPPCGSPGANAYKRGAAPWRSAAPR
jgi:hypothetical protein